MNIVLIGIQGSGKGTLVENLKSNLDFTLISIGELLRNETKTGSKLGQHIKELQTNGVLVELDTVLELINKNLKQNKKPYVIFDGFPRNNAQADELDKMLKLDLVILLNLTKETAINRLLNRLTCTNCGSVFSKNQVKTNVCANCGGKLMFRFDDNLESITKRFEQFYTETHPLIERYKKRNILFEVDAEKTPNEIAELVMRKINEHNN